MYNKNVWEFCSTYTPAAPVSEQLLHITSFDMRNIKNVLYLRARRWLGYLSQKMHLKGIRENKTSGNVNKMMKRS
jgi:hypothetical protein